MFALNFIDMTPLTISESKNRKGFGKHALDVEKI